MIFKEPKALREIHEIQERLSRQRKITDKDFVQKTKESIQNALIHKFSAFKSVSEKFSKAAKEKNIGLKNLLKDLKCIRHKP